MSTPGPSQESGPSGEVFRSFSVEISGQALERMHKQADFREFTIHCDEGPRLGGDDSAPPPLAYFAAAIMF